MTFYEIYSELARLIKKKQPAALATIVAKEGSAPRKPGAKMLVRSDGSAMGSVGGGVVEANAIREALACMKSRRPRTLTFDLTKINDPDTDMRCGGSVTIMTEPVIPPDRAIIFGGGHVGFSIYSILMTIDFEVVIVEDRKKYARKTRFPGASKVHCLDYSRAFEKLDVKEEDYLVICTRAHKNDYDCLLPALRSPARYVGMLGSRSKLKSFREKLRKDGVSLKRIKSLHSPIGLDIGAITPEEIAVSVAAEMISERFSRIDAS